MALKIYDIRVRNPVTRETIKFSGQGETLAAAIKDGLDVVAQVFRPKNDGKTRLPSTVAVILPDGRQVNRTLKEFEGETPFTE